MRLRLLAVVALAMAPQFAGAQVVRGVVRDTSSGSPLAGVVVTIERARPPTPPGAATGARPPATLTNERGEFALSAGAPGEYVVTAKRIGVRQFASAPFALARGETHQLDIALEGVRYALPTVTISDATPCGTRARDRGRIASLWAEATTALTASELSVRDRLFRASITRYERLLDPRSFSVRSDQRNVRRGVTDHAFVSFPAESLAVVGYARTFDDGTIEHFAPDAKVLLSDVFVRDHCFGLAPVTATEVGITFEPLRDRRVADIAGTIWLDARTFALRRVVFRYTDFPVPVEDDRTGGEVHFTRLESGAWIVSRWFMRVPRVAVQPYSSGTFNGQRINSERIIVTSFSEVGGRVEAEGAGAGAGNIATLATLNGRVVDSTGSRPFAGARVSLLGMPFERITSRDGSFRLDSIPAGFYTLVVDHPSYARLGLSAAEQSLEIGEGGSSITLVQAIDTPQILRQLCGYDEVPDSVTAMRLVLPPSDDAPDSVAASPTLELSWTAIREMGRGVLRSRAMSTELQVDAAGGATGCALPRDTRLRVVERGADGTAGRRWEVVTPRHGFLVAVVQEQP